jgi:hypothetical protein
MFGVTLQVTLTPGETFVNVALLPPGQTAFDGTVITGSWYVSGFGVLVICAPQLRLAVTRICPASAGFPLGVTVIVFVGEIAVATFHPEGNTQV